jgi:hypothetical protein
MREDHARGILQPTALVNETYLRLLQQKVAAWKSRAFLRRSGVADAAHPGG